MKPEKEKIREEIAYYTANLEDWLLLREVLRCAQKAFDRQEEKKKAAHENPSFY